MARVMHAPYGHSTLSSERQLSKKELKKKELEELEATLAEFGYNQPEKKDDSLGATHSKKVENVMNGEEDKKDDGTTVESKNAKKKKKKSKEAKEQQDQPNGVEVGNAKEKDESGGVEKAEDAHNVDVKEKLKKLQSMKKKKSRMLQPKLLQRKRRRTTTTSSHSES
ncbi:nucleoporin GLE1-like [Ipomoea triloba]|uniref:nucleoporin GLE1-like n=1 Tax=Ipomoea triloba TaxID=35885 RepID=UPI00125DBF0C|nr:nucleoporin GLE1-like [Ipomoea triloba]